ncbi:hypothetical protein LTR17_018681 [Elasticomyces elasticus]|nr:hypothetical protein LTR17_018681 [Elasticomyces elasticus]
MATTPTASEPKPGANNHATIFRAFSKSLRRNATVSTLHPLTQPPSQPQTTQPQQTHSLQTHEFQALSDNYVGQRLQLQNSHLALLAKDREIENLYYWLNGRGQQTGDLVFRIGELMKLGQQAESELIELETEFDELKEVLGKAVKEVMKLRDMVQRRDGRYEESNEGKAGVGPSATAEDGRPGSVNAEVERLKSAVNAARLHIQYQDQHLEDLEAKIERDRQKMLELGKKRDETWRYALGVEEDLKIAESENELLKAENEELQEEVEVLKVKWEVGSEEYLKLRRECEKERKARVRAERRLAKRMLGRRRLIAVDNVVERTEGENDGWEDVDDGGCEGGWF